ncbi:uncharacterized protein [Primulina eburnea]|uniref:uncharacterized protein n=1 Tax=Primulina eburnea TaxID=1245227 RepID=UPI003C6CA15F
MGMLGKCQGTYILIYSWHTFISCPFARECWENAKVLQKIESQADGAEGFTHWIFKCIKELSGAEMNKIVTILWAIWKQRNSLLWNNHIDSPSRAVDTALRFLYDWISLERSDKVPLNAGTRPQANLWTPPPNGVVKCNIDAAFFDDIQTAGVSMVMRDAEGRFVMARTSLIKGLRCVKEGEAIGLLEALSWIRNLDYPTVMFEVDAQIVHLAMRGNEKDNTEFGEIMESCRDIVSSKPGFSVHFVRRQANEVAHVLAKHSRFFDSPLCG